MRRFLQAVWGFLLAFTAVCILPVGILLALSWTHPAPPQTVLPDCRAMQDSVDLLRGQLDDAVLRIKAQTDTLRVLRRQP